MRDPDGPPARSASPLLRSLLLLALLASPDLSAGEPFRYPEGREGKGELRYINGIPVLTVEGTPEEMGRQAGVLALKPAAAIVGHFGTYLRSKGLDRIQPLIQAASEGLYRRFPERHRRELEALIAAAGADRYLIVLANTAFDLQRIVGCSGLLVAAGRSATGGPLYGRNFDFPFDDPIAEYSLVVVARPEGGKAFAMVSFPGLLASNCGLNADGLTLGANTATRTGDGSPAFEPKGIPYTPSARQVMEECGDLEAFDRWIRAHPPTSMGLLLACDPGVQRVYEITTRNVSFREPDRGLLWCTNHFRAAPMAVETRCRRYERLSRSQEIERLSVADVARLLDAVNQGPRTMQTMVFEPVPRVLHLSIGRGPTSARPLTRLDLKPLLEGKAAFRRI